MKTFVNLCLSMWFIPVFVFLLVIAKQHSITRYEESPTIELTMTSTLERANLETNKVSIEKKYIVPFMLYKVNSNTVASMSKKELYEVECLAKNIFFEARNQSLEGQLAVGFVTLNRLKDARFPKTICNVVTYKKKQTCAFTWWCTRENINWKDKQEVAAWKSIEHIAMKMYVLKNKTEYNFLDGVTHYHTLAVNPAWNKSQDIVLTATIGEHKFYKWI